MQNAHAGYGVSGLEWARAVWHRRKWLALLTLAAGLSATVGVTGNLPNVYESSATVLVEHQQAPKNIAGAAADSGGDAWLRVSELETWLRTVIQHVLSRSQLSDLITRFDLYPDLRRTAGMDAAVERMRRDIRFQFKGVRQPTGDDATIAFSLSYRERDPDTVARVANALAVLYVEENSKIREQQTAGTAQFLRAQLDSAQRDLERQEQRIADFKAHHNGELPEQQAANLAALGQLNQQLIVNIQRRDMLARQRLEIPGVAGDTISARLAKLHQTLADLRARYTDEHPDVVRVKEEIAIVERHLAADGGRRAAAEDSTGGTLVKDPAVEAELAALRSDEQGLRGQIAAYQQRIENTPVIGQELSQLTREYMAASELYQTLLQRYEGAQLEERMGQRRQGDQFRILDPAVASRAPVAPKRSLLRLIGLLVSMGAAVGVAHLAEITDTSFHGVDDLRAFTSVPVLASIPPITTAADLLRRRRRAGLTVLAAALGVAVIISALSHFARSSGVLINLLAGGGGM
ncbi:MAG TPA: GNVR domain-containing protein [bacterium]|nr:GNVR domain-containing protein [bacterium]